MDTSNSQRRIQLILWGVIALVALVAAILIATSGGEGGGLRFLGIGVAAEADNSSTSAREIDQFLGEDGEPVVQQDSVGEFTALYGEPPNTDYARMRIPAIGVDAPVGRWIVDGSVMPDPYGPVDVAFYDLSSWAGLGGAPGGGQNAIFGGHVDLNRDVPYAGGARYRGPAVFWALDQLTPGTIVEVDYAGETLRYAVVWTENLSAAGTEWSQYWSSDVPVDSITLFTCGGEFDFESRSYSQRTLVRAERI